TLVLVQQPVGDTGRIDVGPPDGSARPPRGDRTQVRGTGQIQRGWSWRDRSWSRDGGSARIVEGPEHAVFVNEPVFEVVRVDVVTDHRPVERDPPRLRSLPGGRAGFRSSIVVKVPLRSMKPWVAPTLS